MTSFTSLRRFLEEGALGDTYVYHRGLLANDREKDDIVKKTASELLLAYQKGMCELHQRKMGDGTYEYIATRQREMRTRYFTGCYHEEKLPG